MPSTHTPTSTHYPSAHKTHDPSGCYEGLTHSMDRSCSGPRGKNFFAVRLAVASLVGATFSLSSVAILR